MSEYEHLKAQKERILREQAERITHGIVNEAMNRGVYFRRADGTTDADVLTDFAGACKHVLLERRA